MDNSPFINNYSKNIMAKKKAKEEVQQQPLQTEAETQSGKKSANKAKNDSTLDEDPKVKVDKKQCSKEQSVTDASKKEEKQG